MKTRLLAVAAVCCAVLLVLGYGSRGPWSRKEFVHLAVGTDFQSCVRSAMRDLGLSVDPKFSDAHMIGIALPPRKSTDRLGAYIEFFSSGEARIIFLARDEPDDDDEFVKPLLKSLTAAVVAACTAK